MFKTSCEDPNTKYLTIGKIRFIWRYGRYVGWYKWA